MQSCRIMKSPRRAVSTPAVLVAIAVFVIAAGAGAYYYSTNSVAGQTTTTTPTSTTTATYPASSTASSTATSSVTSTSFSATTSGMNGVVAGQVTVGPSSPVCKVGQSCTVNMTGYSLIFTSQCSASVCPSTSVTLTSWGSYNAFLPPATYVVTMNRCPWVGCASQLPQTLTVIGGQEIVLNINIDTGIR